jgi:DNA-binding MarR family transcriptional regulator
MGSSPCPPPRDDPDQVSRHLSNVLGAFAVAVTDLLAEDAQARGFSPVEQAAVILAGIRDGLSQDDLQRRLGLSQPGTTRLVDRLVARGILIRAPGPDRRTNALRLTPVGAAESRHALARRHQLLKPLTAGLAEEDLRAAADLIDRMLTTLTCSGRSPWQTCRQCDQDGCEAGGHSCPVDVARLSMPADPIARSTLAGRLGGLPSRWRLAARPARPEGQLR